MSIIFQLCVLILLPCSIAACIEDTGSIYSYTLWATQDFILMEIHQNMDDASQEYAASSSEVRISSGSSSSPCCPLLFTWQGHL
jgi:hypothetical protein